MLDEPSELIPVDKQSDDQIVHTFGLRKAERPEHQPLDPRPQIDVFALDFLCALFADGGLCRKFCSGGREGVVAPVGGEIRRPGSRTVRPQ